MDHVIRPLRTAEYALLPEFLLEAVFVHDGHARPPVSILQLPEMQVYVQDFGGENDFALGAEAGGEIVGVVWARIMLDYGHVDDKTPSLAMSVLPDYRRQGIGTALLKAMLALLGSQGYANASLSVQKANTAALRLYEKAGFQPVVDKEDEYIMVCKLASDDSAAE